MLREAYLRTVSQAFSHKIPPLNQKKKTATAHGRLIENYAQHDGRGTHVLEQMVLLLKQKHLRAVPQLFQEPYPQQ